MARFEKLPRLSLRSINPDVAPLSEFLGEAAKIIDMIVDQSADGLEVLRGSSTYTFNGNWKLQAKNGADGYHVSAVHWNYAATTQHRKEVQAADNISRHERRQLGPNKAAVFTGLKTATCFCGPTGPTPKTAQLETNAKPMPNNSAKPPPIGWCSAHALLCLYPNVYLMDRFGSPQIRLLRPALG